VLVALILVAATANLNLSVANVALPSIGQHFNSSQTVLDLVAVGYSLGLACSVLWLGALGDRYGRKMMLLIGTFLAIPMSLLAAYAPSDVVLVIARLGGGIAAGMAYPTTLALITALWAGPGWAYLAGIIAVLLGAVIVFVAFPRPDEEKRMLAAFHALDAVSKSQPTEKAATPAEQPKAAK
jgi:MFS family permease